MKKTFSRRLLLLVICFNLVFFSVFGSYKKASAASGVAEVLAYVLMSMGVSMASNSLVGNTQAIYQNMNDYHVDLGNELEASIVRGLVGGTVYINGDTWGYLKQWAKNALANGLSYDVLNAPDLSTPTAPAWEYYQNVARAYLSSVGMRAENSNLVARMQQAMQNYNVKVFTVYRRINNNNLYIAWTEAVGGAEASDGSIPSFYKASDGSYVLSSPSTYYPIYYMNDYSSSASNSQNISNIADVIVLNGRMSVSIDVDQKEQEVATAIENDSYDIVTGGRQLQVIDGQNTLTGDVALPIDGEGVLDNALSVLDNVFTGVQSLTDALANVQAIPVDLATDKTITGDSTITDALDQLNPSDILTGFQFELDELFPFCIPFDLSKMFGLLNSSPMAPSWTWKFPNGAGGYIEQEFDLSAFDNVASVCRTMELLAFCVGLAFATRNLIRG